MQLIVAIVIGSEKFPWFRKQQKRTIYLLSNLKVFNFEIALLVRKKTKAADSIFPKNIIRSFAKNNVRKFPRKKFDGMLDWCSFKNYY